MPFGGMPIAFASLAMLRRNYIELPAWVTWVWVAILLFGLIGALLGWWRSTRSTNHGAEALARVRKARSKGRATNSPPRGNKPL